MVNQIQDQIAELLLVKEVLSLQGREQESDKVLHHSHRIYLKRIHLRKQEIQHKHRFSECRRVLQVGMMDKTLKEGQA